MEPPASATQEEVHREDDRPLSTKDEQDDTTSEEIDVLRENEGVEEPQNATSAQETIENQIPMQAGEEIPAVESEGDGSSQVRSNLEPPRVLNRSNSNSAEHTNANTSPKRSDNLNSTSSRQGKERSKLNSSVLDNRELLSISHHSTGEMSPRTDSFPEHSEPARPTRTSALKLSPDRSTGFEGEPLTAARGLSESVPRRRSGQSGHGDTGVSSQLTRELTHDDDESDASFFVSPSPTPLSFVVSQPATVEQQGYVPALQHPHSFHYPVQIMQPGMPPIPQSILTVPPPVAHPAAQPGGRRKIVLHLQEEISTNRRSSFFSRSSRFLQRGQPLQSVQENVIDRGAVSVSWFEGTKSPELQEHVRRTVIRKMGLHRDTELSDMRIIDETVDPPEEIVLSPFIPDGSRFSLKYSMGATANIPENPFGRRHGHRLSDVSAPDSPSASPSPFPSTSDLNTRLLVGKLRGLQPGKSKSARAVPEGEKGSEDANEPDALSGHAGGSIKGRDDATETASKASDLHEGDIMGYNPEDQVETRLRELADLLITDRRARMKFNTRRQREKRQVIFVLANYFVLFLSLIFVFLQIQARLPNWLAWVETQLENVQKCATDQDALFECVSKGDFSGLVASLILWVSRSAATKRFFLFGFETPKRLWTVVYESAVTAVCWGTSYMLIRRGMNPDTRSNFLRKYWKDAVYGSLAGFNASFMKQVLKNLIPQEALEDALQERQLKILSWWPTFH